MGFLMSKRSSRPVAAEGLSEATAMCLGVEQQLEAAGRKRVTSMVNVMAEMRDGWRYKLENDLAYVLALTAAREAVRGVRQTPRAAALPAHMRFQAGTLFLRQCHAYLASDPERRERMILISGTVTPDGLRVLSHMEQVTADEQSAAYVRAAPAATHTQLVNLTEIQGHPFLAMAHTHVMRGAESTRPSSVDLANQDRFVRIGCEAIGMIFSLDGFVRFFSTLTDFDLVLYGAGGSIVHDAPREKVIKLEVA